MKTVAQELMERMGRNEFVQWQTVEKPTFTEMRQKLMELKNQGAMKVKNPNPRWTTSQLERE